MILIDLPKPIEDQFRSALGDRVDEVAREALILAGYGCAGLSIGQVAKLLNCSINDAYGFLKEHGVSVNYSVDDYEEDLVSLRRLFPDARL